VDLGHPWTALFDGVPGARTYPTSRTETIGPVTVTGLSFDDGFDTGLKVDRQPGLHVVLAHGPDFALGDIDADLLIAGHTHGGQVRVPFFGPPITFSRVPRAWAAGRTELPGGRVLYVSRGVGVERRNAPRLRFNCRPEVAVIEVVPAP
jgi:hypothetical protein